MRTTFLLWALALALAPHLASAQSTRPGVTDKLPHIHVDVKARRVEVECESLNVDAPLEFLCVTNGGNEHESVLRTPAKPSDIHLALLMLGLTPGAPASFSESKNLWFPPHGPPLSLTATFSLNGQAISVPAWKMMRSVKEHKTMPGTIWVFDGSRVMPDGVYAADLTGYVVSICNFDLTLIDVPELVSNANETLQWECNPEAVPARGTPVTLVIAPSDEPTSRAAAGVPADQFNPGPGTPAHGPAGASTLPAAALRVVQP